MHNENRIHCEDISPPNWNGIPDLSLLSTHLWKIAIHDFRDQIHRLSPLLSEEESIRTSKYHQQKDKERFVIGKGVLRQILARYLECNPSDIEFHKGINNKPCLHSSLRVHFNVSYSHGCILIAVSKDVIGVDIEYICPGFDYPLLLANCFMETEIQVITSSPLPLSRFFQFWTRKEALLKATSLGLDDYLTDFSCLDGFQSIPPNLRTEDDWRIKSFLSDDSYWISLAQRDARPVLFINAHSIL